MEVKHVASGSKRSPGGRIAARAVGPAAAPGAFAAAAGRPAV